MYSQKVTLHLQRFGNFLIAILNDLLQVPWNVQLLDMWSPS